MTFEVQINNSSAAEANYIGWTPAPCRIRQNGGTMDVSVTMSSGGPTGGIVFYGTGSTPGAATATLTATVPQSGAWCPFWIGGRFGNPSVSDLDAMVRLENSANPGTLIGMRTLMVRVRKDANSLTTGERDRFLNALGRLNNRGSGLFQTFRDMHKSDALDEAHGRPAFLPWHRAYLLDLERELQALDKTVALPYWRFDVAAPNVFTPDFMGGPPATSTSFLAAFSATNPLRQWTTDGTLGITRFPLFNTSTSPARITNNEAATLALGTAFIDFRELEGDPHGYAHTSFRPSYLRDPATAPKDPLFFLLHCNVDRLWAKWQWMRSRFDTTNTDSYDEANADRIGHHLADTMWPWNGNTTAPRPSTAPGGTLASSTNVTGPGGSPTVAMMFDYQGRISASAKMAFDYDDVPGV